jgi:glycosyltransferase involved in cell wall biosynthesis
MKVLHVVASLNRDTGGVARSVPALADAQCAAGIDAGVASLDYRRHGPMLLPTRAEHHGELAGPLTRWFRGWSPAFARTLSRLTAEAAIVHSHGLWMQPNRDARIVAARHRRPRVVSLRGMLEPWSRQRSRGRKALAWWAFERRNLASAALLHATSAMEVAAAQAVLGARPIALLPNGVAVPAAIDAGAARERLGELPAPRLALFLSRLHPKKGLELLLDAWAAVAGDASDWCLAIAGTGAPEYRAALDERVRRLGIGARVKFLGVVDGALRADLLAGAELHLLPTYSENFGNSVAESLAHGCPVITTTAAPWQGLIDRRAGWWIAPEQGALEAALAAALALPTADLRAMGERGRRWMQDDFAWEALGRRWRETYAWLLGAGSRPAFVHDGEGWG